MNRFTVLIVELYTYVKTYQIIYFQCVQCIAFQLHLNKAVKKENNSLGEQQQKDHNNDFQAGDYRWMGILVHESSSINNTVHTWLFLAIFLKPLLSLPLHLSISFIFKPQFKSYLLSEAFSAYSTSSQLNPPMSVLTYTHSNFSNSACDTSRALVLLFKSSFNFICVCDAFEGDTSFVSMNTQCLINISLLNDDIQSSTSQA